MCLRVQIHAYISLNIQNFNGLKFEQSLQNSKHIPENP